MPGLIFQDQVPRVASAPNRTDIVCFVGFVPQRPTADIDNLLDMPVPVESWDQFDALYAWERRPIVDGTRLLPTYLGAAVRSFFAQGGRTCYVVRAGDPWPVGTPRGTRLSRIADLIPGHPYRLSSSPVDRASWHGIGHIFGLPDVSFLCLPDLADACAADADLVDTSRGPLPVGPEAFVECGPSAPPQQADHWTAGLQAPRCRDRDYADWAAAVSNIGRTLASYAREVQLVVALPLPVAGGLMEADPSRFLIDDGEGPLARSAGPGGIASAFVQLVYPWIRTSGSTDLPEQLESPDGVLVGALARNALLHGTFHSAARQGVTDVYQVEPVLTRAQLTLIDRVSVVGNLPGGLDLLSDVTTSLDAVYRPASVGRLVASIARAARRLGEDLVFEASGQTLWTSLRERIEALLLGLLQDGALRGDAPAEAFQVRCDRATMTQNDIDNGRVIAEVAFDAAAPVDTVRVVLALNDQGEFSVRQQVVAA